MKIFEPALPPPALDIDDGETRVFLRQGSPRLHVETMDGLLSTLSIDLTPERCRAVIAAMTWQLAWFAHDEEEAA